MTCARHITMAALAFGTAILATTTLQTTPAEALFYDIKIGSDASTAVHAIKSKGIPPIVGNQPNPNVPGGAKLPPIVGNQPNPNVPGPGQKGPGTKGTHHHYGVYVGIHGHGHRPCWWLRRNYYVTGNVYWLNRLRACLWRHLR